MRVSFNTIAPFWPAPTEVVPAVKKLEMPASTLVLAVTVIAAPDRLIKTIASSVAVAPSGDETLTAVTPCCDVKELIAETRSVPTVPKLEVAPIAPIAIPLIVSEPAVRPSIAAAVTPAEAKLEPTWPLPKPKASTPVWLETALIALILVCATVCAAIALPRSAPSSVALPARPTLKETAIREASWASVKADTDP